jgi:uncharacterized membrane protein YdjX (TVP38/TMEM64 family)
LSNVAATRAKDLQTPAVRRADLLRWVSVGVIVTAILVIAWSVPVFPIVNALQSRAHEYGAWGVLGYLALYVVFATFLVPVWPMPFLAGAVYGPVWGTVLASLGCLIAATATFFLARAIGRTSLRACLESSPRMRALEKTVQTSDWKIVAAVRLSHFMTFGMQNYAFGLTQIKYKTMAITTWAVTLPGTSLQAYLGHLGFTSVDSWQAESMSDWQTWAMRAVGLCVIGAAVAYVAYWGRGVYRQALKEQLEHQYEVESASDFEAHGGGWSWGLVSLLATAACLSAIAVWAVAERNTLREMIEDRLADRADVRDVDRPGRPEVGAS